MTAAPRLLITSGPEAGPERRWILDVVVGRWLGLEYELVPGPSGRTTIRLAGERPERAISLPDRRLAGPDGSWLEPRRDAAVAWMAVATADGTRRLPDPTAPIGPTPRTEPTAAFVPDGDGRAGLADIFGLAFEMLSRLEEVASPAADAHGRYPAAASLAVRAGFGQLPVVDAWVDALGGEMEALWPGLRTRRWPLRLVPTHDVDLPYAVRGVAPAQVLRAIAGDLLRRHDGRLAIDRARSWLDALAGGTRPDPYDTFDLLMEASERAGVRSTFYFLAGTEPGERDFRYRLEDGPYLRILRRVHERGHLAGLHASYESYRSAERLARETAALQAAARLAGFEQEAWGVRQHYLRLAVPETWRHQAAAGLAHDSSLGWAEEVGFRAGTCRPFPTFDLLARRPAGIEERPLVVMDAAMEAYDRVDLPAAAAAVTGMVAACRVGGGDAVLLYHNSSLPDRRRREHYRDLMRTLAGPEARS